MGEAVRITGLWPAYDPASCRSAPYGAWPSPVSAAMAAAAGVRLSEPWLGSDGSIWWLERRPSNGGRTTLVRDGEDVTRAGGRTCARACTSTAAAPGSLHGDTAFFSELRRPAPLPAGPRRARRAPITPEPPRPVSMRYADGRVTPDGELIVCVRETHGERRARERPGGPAGRRRRRAARARLRPRLLRLPAPQPRRHPGVAGPAGTTPTCRGTAPSCGWRPLDDAASARGWWPAARASRSGSPTGAPTARSTTCPTATAGGTSTARASSSPTSEAELGYPQWVLRRLDLRLPARRVASCACASSAAWSASACCAPDESRLEDLGLPTRPWATRTCAATATRVVLVAAVADERRGRGDLERAARGPERGADGRDEPLDPAWASDAAARSSSRAPAGAPRTRFWYPPTNPDFEAPGRASCRR